MAPIRVLVVDDSAFMRHSVARVLGAAPEIEIVGSVPDGEQGLRAVASLRPDVITLDVEMPVLDGLGMLRRLMVDRPTRVVMLSSLTTEGAAVTLDALELGAIDFAAKPSGSLSVDIGRIGDELIAKVGAAASVTDASPDADRDGGPGADLPRLRECGLCGRGIGAHDHVGPGRDPSRRRRCRAGDSGDPGRRADAGPAAGRDRVLDRGAGNPLDPLCRAPEPARCRGRGGRAHARRLPLRRSPSASGRSGRSVSPKPPRTTWSPRTAPWWPRVGAISWPPRRAASSWSGSRR